MRAGQDFRVRVAQWWFEFITGQFNEQAEGVAEIKRIHKTAILDARVGKTCGLQAGFSNRDGCLADPKRDVVKGAFGLGQRLVAWFSVFVCENCDRAPVTAIEVKVVDVKVIEVGLLEY